MFAESIVVVPWDFSEHSKLALDFAVKHVSADRIRVICVLEMPNPYATGVLWGEDAEQKAREKCREQFLATVGDSSAKGLEFVPEFGDPATEIVRAAKEWDAGLIVISSHGRSGISRLMLGSTAQKVSKLSNCPVLLLPSAWHEIETNGPSEGSSD